MANYYGVGRSNYFTVKDPKAFEDTMNALPDIEIITNGKGQYGLMETNPDGGGWPSSMFDEEHDEPIEIDIPEAIMPHLADGEVAVMMEAGHEKSRYVIGWAEAFNNKGERRFISLLDIYKDAEELGENCTVAEY